MPKEKRTRLPFKWPEIELGGWQGEFADGPSGGIGQYVHPGPPPTVVESTYLFVGAAVISPVTKRWWPALVAFWVRTPFQPDRTEAGYMFKSENAPSLNLSFEINREQFTEIAWLFREKILKDFHFTVLPGDDNRWPLKDWGAGIEL